MLLISIPDSLLCFLRLAFLVGANKIVSQQMLHNTCIPHLVLGLGNEPKKTAVEAQTSMPRPVATRRVQDCYTLPLKRGEV